MKITHSKYGSNKPVDIDREKEITAFAKRLMSKWEKQKLNKKEAPAGTEAKNF